MDKEFEIILNYWLDKIASDTNRSAIALERIANVLEENQERDMMRR